MPLRLIPDLPSSPQGLKPYYACVGNKKATVGQIYESTHFSDQKTRWQILWMIHALRLYSGPCEDASHSSTPGQRSTLS